MNRTDTACSGKIVALEQRAMATYLKSLQRTDEKPETPGVSSLVALEQSGLSAMFLTRVRVSV